MVKRKRTLSVKENTDSVHQSSENDHGNCDAKRPKPQHGNPPGKVVDAGGGEVDAVFPTPLNSAAVLPTPTTSLTATITTVTNEGPPLPANFSLAPQPLPHVPSSATQTPAPRPPLQLRTSARVLNKQRREETNKAEPPQVSGTAKKLEASGADGDFQEEEDGLVKKRRRAWELWSMEDKNIFFESINECGKDFEAIQTYLTTKLRKKGAPRSQVKNKDQVRHFYYRTWHKISKYITFNEGVKKATQELYGLINYGELRKKIGSNLDERRALKLQELIRKGSTSVRVKGKSIRVRTPICRALKRLNQIEEHREHTELRVPTIVMMEMVPGSVHAWCHVQGRAHNPRIRMNCPPQCSLATIFTHLQQKWRHSNLKLLDTLSSRVNFPLQLPETSEPVLRLKPAPGVNIKPITVQPEVVLKSSFVSLSSHEARLRRRGEKVGRTGKRKEARQKDTEKQKDAGVDKQTEGKQPRINGEVVDEKLEKEGKREGLREGRGISEGETVNEGEGNKRSKGREEGERTEEVYKGDTGGHGEPEDFGEASQEEADDLSDLEVEFDNDGSARQILSPDKQNNHIQVKEEPRDLDLSPPLEFSMEPDIIVKEEGEGDALRQLLALETVAGAGVTDDDEVVCTGESTRLTAHMADVHRGQQAHSQPSEEEHGAGDSPDPDNEDGRDGACGDGVGAQDGSEIVQDIEAWVLKVRAGWTAADVGGITVGELYLMFGQNKKICLEYEFEDKSSSKAKDNDDETCNKNNNTCDKTSKGSNSGVDGSGVDCDIKTSDGDTVNNTVNKCNDSLSETGEGGDSGSVVPIVTSLDIPGSGMAAALAPGKDSGVQGKEKEDKIKEEGKEEKSEVEEKKAVVENLSGMLAQLLSMTRAMTTKSTESTCPCGHVCGRVNVLRSPAGRGHGPGNLGKSPVHTRSPRTSRLASALSPGVPNPGTPTTTRSPLAGTTRPLRERNKPASAKKLIADTDQHNVVEARVVEGCPDAAIVLPTSTVAPNPTQPLEPGPGGGVGLSGVSEVKVVVGAGTGEGAVGEFKVPLGPAPRHLNLQQANFNAQLSKLLPRYNNRVGRRVVRKSVMVQRQQPLLPKTVIPPVTMRVLQHQITHKDSTSGYIPISVSSQSASSSTSPSPSIPGAFTSRPQIAPAAPTLPFRGPIIQPSQSPVTRSNTPFIQSQVNLGNQVIQPLQSPGSHGLITQAQAMNQSTQLLQPVLQANSVTASTPVQLSVLSPQTPLTQPSMPTIQPGANAISVNISGHPLMTVEMPTILPAPVIQQTTTPLTTTQSTVSIEMNKPKHNSQSLSPQNNASLTNGILSSAVSQALSELPDLSTPPSTPQPSPVKPQRNFEGVASLITSSSPPFPSPQLFSSPLSDDSLPTLDTGLATTPLSLSCTLSPVISLSAISPINTSPTPCIQSLLTPATTRNLELSPPPSQTNTLSSLLNTPTPQLDQTQHSPPRPPPSISALLSSSTDLPAKSFPTVLSADDSVDSTSGPSGTMVPEIHIPEGSINIPMLDISIGGTVTIGEQVPGLLSTADPEAALQAPLAATSSITTTGTTSIPTTTMVGVVSLQDNSSSDKLLDITLGNSNSNSCFSSLLAAAAQPRLLDNPSLLDTGSISQTGVSVVGVGGLPQVSGLSSSETLNEGTLSGFPQLSNTHLSPPSSPSRLLQQTDSQWLNNEVNDFSLSSFLGHLESPVKNNGNNSRGSTSSQSQGISSAQTPTVFIPSFSSVYNENSVDFTSTFAEMKAQVSGSFKQ